MELLYSAIMKAQQSRTIAWRKNCGKPRVYYIDVFDEVVGHTERMMQV
jgi:hypothetical protein